MSQTVAVVVITKNEEKNIRDCLESAKWADEIVVVDDESTDNTVAIAKEFTDKVFHRKMDIEGRHRNWAYSQASTKWVLSLDADERITPELAEEVREVISKDEPEVVVYAIPIRAYIGKNYWIQGAGYYPAHKDRLFIKGKFQYEEVRIHPMVQYEGKSKNLTKDIIHYSYHSFSDLFAKFNRETSLEAEKWIQDGRKQNFLKITRKSMSRFLKFYFQKGGWRHGFMGFFFSYLHSLYQFISYVKYWEMKNLNQEGK